MKQLAALICIAVCAISLGINTYQGNWFLAICYLAGVWIFWQVFEDK
jgi:hypothetical protein